MYDCLKCVVNMPWFTPGITLTGISVVKFLVCLPMCMSVCICSYDSVVAMTDLGGVEPEPSPALPKQCLVSSRWLTDTDNFNEWMNEEDYQLIIVVSLQLLGRS